MKKKPAKYTAKNGGDLPETVYVQWSKSKPSDRGLVFNRDADGAYEDTGNDNWIVGVYRLDRRVRLRKADSPVVEEPA